MRVVSFIFGAMYVKPIPKIESKTGVEYTYYRLCESYRLGNKVRHRSILSLGSLKELSDKKQRKALADRIEQLLKGLPGFIACHNPLIEELAQKYCKQILDQKLVDTAPGQTRQSSFHQVDINSLELEHARTVGSEWMCLQALHQLEMQPCLLSAGFAEEDIPLALAHLIARAVSPASEHATASWMQDNSAVCELLHIDASKVSYHQLYKVSLQYNKSKEKIEAWLSRKTSDLFSLQDKIVLYDLTNSYFEGRKLRSNLARFGKSKEKRSDARLITLALVVNVEGFVKYSQVLRGNISEPSTLEATLEALGKKTSATASKPMVVMDAGIATDENIEKLKALGYQYLCVSRKKLKDYKAALEKGQPVEITDKRKSPISMLVIDQPGEDTYMYVRSERKAQKEVSMHENFTSHFEEGLQQVLAGIHKKGGTKKLTKVWERIGRLKEKYPSAHRFYQIQVEEQGAIATNLTWKKIQPTTRTEEGVYFLRTSQKGLSEHEFWSIYNTIREIEAAFRTLKADLQMRPVFHQTDDNTVAHLNLAVIAYQMVNAIRYQLKAKGIHHDWSNLVRIMGAQQTVTVTMLNREGRKLHIRKCTKPEAKAMAIYDALNYKAYPFKQKSVLPETEVQKNESLAKSHFDDA